jgi:hypothetical protein
MEKAKNTWFEDPRWGKEAVFRLAFPSRSVAGRAAKALGKEYRVLRRHDPDRIPAPWIIVAITSADDWDRNSLMEHGFRLEEVAERLGGQYEWGRFWSMYGADSHASRERSFCEDFKGTRRLTMWGEGVRTTRHNHWRILGLVDQLEVAGERLRELQQRVDYLEGRVAQARRALGGG